MWHLLILILCRSWCRARTGIHPTKLHPLCLGVLQIRPHTVNRRQASHPSPRSHLTPHSPNRALPRYFRSPLISYRPLNPCRHHLPVSPRFRNMLHCRSWTKVGGNDGEKIQSLLPPACNKPAHLLSQKPEFALKYQDMKKIKLEGPHRRRRS